MNTEQIISGSFSVGRAEKLFIDDAWSNINWDRNHSQIQFHRLYYPLSGRAMLRLYDKELELLPGRVYFIPAYSIVKSHIEGRMEKYYVHFQVDSPMLDMYRYISNKLSVEAGENTAYLFDAVLDNYSDPSYSSRLRVQGAMNLIIADFLANISADRSSISKFDPVLTYINEHYRESLTLSVLADIMGFSPMYFSNVFKKVFNVSPKQYILSKRLAESQRLLLETKMPVKEIAYSVGFENENYFSEYFSSRVGVSALKFRSRSFSSEQNYDNNICKKE